MDGQQQGLIHISIYLEQIRLSSKVTVGSVIYINLRSILQSYFWPIILSHPALRMDDVSGVALPDLYANSASRNCFFGSPKRESRGSNPSPLSSVIHFNPFNTAMEIGELINYTLIFYTLRCLFPMVPFTFHNVKQLT